MSIRPTTTAAYNVLHGWLTRRPVPPIPKHRNATRAGYRKTQARRGAIQDTQGQDTSPRREART